MKPFRSCSQNSITMNTESSDAPTTISATSTTLGWRIAIRMFASRRAVRGNPSRSFSIFTFFRAFTSPVRLSRALNTTP